MVDSNERLGVVHVVNIRGIACFLMRYNKPNRDGAQRFEMDRVVISKVLAHAKRVEEERLASDNIRIESCVLINSSTKTIKETIR
jgi:hypothetical protein